MTNEKPKTEKSFYFESAYSFLTFRVFFLLDTVKTYQADILL